MPTFEHEWGSLLLWGAIGFAVTFFTNSFIEWAVHKFIMHKPNRLIPYGYLHTTSHHARFGADATYHARTKEDLSHILFTWKEYTLFPLLCLVVYSPVEYLLDKPILLGTVASAFVGLQMFNSLHWRFHAPRDTWFQRTRFFRFLKEHHRIHHADMDRNFNVFFIPLADFCLGTLAVKRRPD